jgi:hypothetical protein
MTSPESPDTFPQETPPQDTPPQIDISLREGCEDRWRQFPELEEPQYQYPGFRNNLQFSDLEEPPFRIHDYLGTLPDRGDYGPLPEIKPPYDESPPDPKFAGIFEAILRKWQPGGEETPGALPRHDDAHGEHTGQSPKDDE